MNISTKPVSTLSAMAITASPLAPVARGLTTLTLSLSSWVLTWLSPVLPTNAATLVGPSPYLSFNDSPFKGSNFSYFHLENFEDGALNMPGVIAPYGGAFNGLSLFQDSVDADDGVIDGLGRNGASFGAGTLPYGFWFIFDPTVLGALPTHAGIVWTDAHTSEPIGYGYGWGTFEAFDAVGNSLGAIGPTLLGDGDTLGRTLEDRFFGVIHEEGISAIRFSMPNVISGITMDHLQYGRLSQPNVPPSVAGIPEPSSMLGLLLAGGVGAGLKAQRSRKVMEREGAMIDPSDN